MIDEPRLVLARHEGAVVAPGERVTRVLGTVEAREARGDDRRRLGATIAIEIPRPQEVRRLDDERAAAVSVPPR